MVQKHGSYDLPVAKFFVCGFDISLTRLLSKYLTNRKHRTKKARACVSWENITSILRPLLFNIDLYDLFFLLDSYDIANYADDNTPYVRGESIKSVTESLKMVSVAILNDLVITKCRLMPINTMP